MTRLPPTPTACQRHTNRLPTSRQVEVLRYLAEHMRRAYRPPTIREICEQFGFASTKAAADHIDALVRKGLIERDAKTSRGTRITPSGRRWLQAEVVMGGEA